MSVIKMEIWFVIFHINFKAIGGWQEHQSKEEQELVNFLIQMSHLIHKQEVVSKANKLWRVHGPTPTTH